jgi:hypothetical protein
VARFFSLRGSATHSLAFASLVGFGVDALMGCGKDFGKVGEIELFDKGEGDGALVAFGPTFDPANKFLNHVNKDFIS